MATHVALGYRAENGSSIMRTFVEGAETVASGSASTLIATDNNQVWEVSATDDVWVTFGPSPEAEEDGTFLVWGGTTRHFKAEPGDKIAVVSA